MSAYERESRATGLIAMTPAPADAIKVWAEEMAMAPVLGEEPDGRAFKEKVLAAGRAARA